MFLEAGAEIGRGRGFPGSDSGRNGAGATALYAHAGGDIGESNSWRAGLSMLNAKATEQDLTSTDRAGRTVPPTRFSGSTRVWIGDCVWKWAPNGNATRTNFKLQGEYLRSTRDGQLADGRRAAAAAYARRAVGLVPAGRLPVHAALARRAAHRAARLRDAVRRRAVRRGVPARARTR